jgi:hypothetical protein
MHDHVRRLVGLEGFEVKRVNEEGDRLDLEVERVARAGCCPGAAARRSRSRSARWRGCATCRSRGASRIGCGASAATAAGAAGERSPSPTPSCRPASG